jgi:hypothetical protein
MHAGARTSTPTHATTKHAQTRVCCASKTHALTHTRIHAHIHARTHTCTHARLLARTQQTCTRLSVRIVHAAPTQEGAQTRRHGPGGIGQLYVQAHARNTRLRGSRTLGGVGLHVRLRNAVQDDAHELERRGGRAVRLRSASSDHPCAIVLQSKRADNARACAATLGSASLGARQVGGSREQTNGAEERRGEGGITRCFPVQPAPPPSAGGPRSCPRSRGTLPSAAP